MTRSTNVSILTSVCLMSCLGILSPAFADQVPGTTGPAGPALQVVPLQAEIVDPMSRVNAKYICGGQVSAGTPIAGDANGADGDLLTLADNGTSGVIPLSGIPAGAKIRKAILYWSVLTDSLEEANPGMNITFAGSPITGTKIGFVAGETPCFTQDNTIGWKADVTSLVTGNGNYVVAGFPGGNNISGSDFTEGATLAVLYDDGSKALKQLVEYEGMAVTNSPGETASQTLNGFSAASSAVQATWYPVIGNGQRSPDTLLFGSVDLDSTVLDGSTAAFAAGTCSYLDQPANAECYWDDDNVDVSSAFLGGETSVTVEGGTPAEGGDCHSWLAMQLVVTTDQDQFDTFCEAGGAYVDGHCPPDSYKNHGEYMKCVANAAQAYLAENDVLCAELQSCIVNPRARSDVGKP